jgi:nucleoside-diphosphate-sugar epimerase
MRIAITGATGFLGRYVVSHLADLGHECRCWYRPSSDRTGIHVSQRQLCWVPGSLGDPQAADSLVADCDAVVHAALDRPGQAFRGGEGNLIPFLERNFIGTIRLIEAARTADVPRFIFISTCAVHEVILGDRPLDETHPLWPTSHYGAHKAAIEAFVQSFGFGEGYPICALRPTGIYGLAHTPSRSKWCDLIRAVARGEDVNCNRGGKEVHAHDVARAVGLLLTADGIPGQAYNCYDRYISEREVAAIAKEESGGRGAIHGAASSPNNEIVTDKLKALGMTFGGRPLLEQTVGEILDVIKRS